MLEDPSPGVLAAAIEANEHDLFTCIARHGGKKLVVEGDISWVVGKPSWPNFMFKPLFTIDGVNKRLAAIGDRIEQGEVPPVLKVGPGASPVDLAAHLKAAGFADMGLSRPGLALDLHGAQLERDVPDGESLGMRE